MPSLWHSFLSHSKISCSLFPSAKKPSTAFTAKLQRVPRVVSSAMICELEINQENTHSIEVLCTKQNKLKQTNKAIGTLITGS